MSQPVTMTQVRAAIAIFTAFEMSQDTPEQTEALGHAVVDALPDLYANGPEAAAGAFCALMRPLLQLAALSNSPQARAATWRTVVDRVTSAEIPTT